MHIGIGRLDLRLSESRSLKDRRQVARSLTSRIRNQFSVAVAEDAEERLTSKMRVRVLGPDVTADRMSALRTVLEKHGGDCAFFLHITIPGETETVLSLGDGRGVTASEGLRRDVDSLFGRPVAECTV